MHKYYETKSIAKTKKATYCRVCNKDLPVGSSKKNIKYYSHDGIDGKDVCVECYDSVSDPQKLLDIIFDPGEDEVE